jgi:hypothetical protein
MMARLSILIFCTLILFTACSNDETRLSSTDELYRPPTQNPTLSPTVPIVDDSEAAGIQSDEIDETPTPSCTNNLLFLDDITIPDGTLVEPEQTLDKRWSVQNNGSCNWDDRYQVRLIAGPAMGMPNQQALNPALSGTEVVIRMVFIAPNEPGNFRSAWQAYGPQGNPFGDPFFIDILVTGEETIGGGE